MPVTKQAIKKVRQDKRKAAYNLLRKTAYKKAVKNFLGNPGDATLRTAYSALDLAAKTNVIHKRKASRLKSRLSKKIKSKVSSKPASPAVKSKKTSK